MMDRDGNGRIDQSEIDALPPQAREFMQSRGIELRAGMSTDEMRDRMRESFSRGGDDRGRGEDDRRRDDDRRGEDRSEGTTNRSAYQPPQPFRPRERERVTIDLPPAWSELDTDYDGQIGYYEWILARREELDLFNEMDMDFDGMLTPGELKLHEELVKGSSESILTKMLYKPSEKRLVIVGGSSATGGGSAQVASGREKYEKMSKEEQQGYQKFAGWADSDKDGRITAEEIEKNPRIRPMFEATGTPIRDMSTEEFAHVAVAAKEAFEARRREGGDRDRGDRDRGDGDRGGRDWGRR